MLNVIDKCFRACGISDRRYHVRREREPEKAMNIEMRDLVACTGVTALPDAGAEAVVRSRVARQQSIEGQQPSKSYVMV